jgi:ABC-type lipoprotein release transport system permease subunit
MIGGSSIFVILMLIIALVMTFVVGTKIMKGAKKEKYSRMY